MERALWTNVASARRRPIAMARHTRNRMMPAASVSVPPARLVHAMRQICEHEGLEPAETAGVLAVALT